MVTPIGPRSVNAGRKLTPWCSSGFQRMTQHLEVIGVSKWLVEASLVRSRTGRSGRCSQR